MRSPTFFAPRLVSPPRLPTVPIGNNVTFQQPNPLDYREDLLRIDYRINSKHTLYGRYIHDKNELIDPFGTFITTQLPTIPSLRRRPGNVDSALAHVDGQSDFH